MINDEGEQLNKKFVEAVNFINKHTKELGNQYCGCGECSYNRQKLNSISERMHQIGYQRKAMF